MSDDEGPDNVIRAPFADELGREAALVGVAQARAEAEQRRAWALERVAVAAEIVDAYDSEWLNNPKKLSKLFKSAAAKLALDLLRGETPVQNASQAAAAMNALMSAGRLEAGEHTSMGVNVDTEEQLERIKALRDEAQRRIEHAADVSGAQVTPISS